MRNKLAEFFVILLFLTLMPPLDSKRGGGGFSIGGSRGRGNSNVRTGISGGNRGGGSTFGGVMGNRNRGHNTGGGGGVFGGGGGGSAYNRGTNYGKPHQQGGQQYNPGGYNHGTSWGHGNNNYNRPRFTSHGHGSHSRANQFKNMIVGAAAGYLAYQAGKHIIRAAAGPMMWNNRPYYWGQQYYRPSGGMSQMCRMPIDSSDPQFSNVYFQDQTRPREIVWSCSHYEYCCGSECCRGGSSSSFSGGIGRSTGSILLILLLLCCCIPLIYGLFRRSRGFFGREKYAPGLAQAPPPYY